jgi:hypothetical protein
VRSRGQTSDKPQGETVGMLVNRRPARTPASHSSFHRADHSSKFSSDLDIAFPLPVLLSRLEHLRGCRLVPTKSRGSRRASAEWKALAATGVFLRGLLICSSKLLTL